MASLMGMLTILNAAPSRGVPVSDNRGGWGIWPWVNERYPGAWQRNDQWTTDTVLAYHAVYACVTRISNDFGKLRPKLVELDEATGIWTEVKSSAYSPVLRRPNNYQNHIQFKQWWAISLLLRGNTYALKERDRRGVVVREYLLDPSKVTPLVAPDASVYYELKPDNLAGLDKSIVVPASEIIHDRINCLYHPLIGTSPIFACGAAANTGLQIESSQSTFFANGSKVSGQLLIPTLIDQKKADEFRDKWKTQFTGDGAGQIAVLSGGMKFEPMQMTAVDAQMIETMKWSAEAVCTAFHVPPFKIGIRDVTYANAEIANQIYYSDCLQSPIEQFELCQDDGLGIGEGIKVEGRTLGVELDLDGLLRMDTATAVTTFGASIRSGLFAPNEARARVGLKPLEGGDTIYMQHQDYPIEQLAERKDLNTPAPPPRQIAPPATEQSAEPVDVVQFFNALSEEACV